MEAYAIYLSIVLITKAKIDVGAVAHFETIDQCEQALTSDKYGEGIFKRDSICKKVDTI